MESKSFFIFATESILIFLDISDKKPFTRPGPQSVKNVEKVVSKSRGGTRLTKPIPRFLIFPP